MNNLRKLKKRLHDIVDVAVDGDKLSRAFDIALFILISLNVLAVILESIQTLSIEYNSYFKTFEIVSVIIFSIEYAVRVWSCTEHNEFRKPISGRIHYIITPFAITDLLAILPFYLPLLIPFDMRFLRALRLIRLFRIFKLGRYTESLRTILKVMNAKKSELMTTAFAVIILLIITSSLMYLVEYDVQPKAFSSIPAAMWWAIITLTTVGYGDIYPVTALGKLLGACIAILGIGLFALPAGILGSGFVDEIRQKNSKKSICPHCGKAINE